MTKRIRKVFPSDQVIHLWANQSQSDARSANVFFEDKDIYSYGRHYKLGTITKYKGVNVALINVTGYSVTTAKHIHKAWHAVSHMPRLKTDATFDIIKALENKKSQLESDMQGHFRCRKFWNDSKWTSEYNHLRDSIKEFNQTCKDLKSSKYQVKVSPKYIADYNAHIVKMRKRMAELESPEYVAKRNELALKRASKSIQDWRNGGKLTEAVRKLNPQIIRINGGSVQTSRGAEVPLDQAKALLSRVMRNEAKQGDTVGAFQFTKVENDTVTIGCHKISLAEAKAVLMPLTLVKAG